jgi:VanZ family protein
LLGFPLGFRLTALTLLPVTSSASHRRRRWIFAAALAGLIVIASSRSAVEGPSVRNFDKVAHFSVYGLLATLVVRALISARAFWAIVIVSIFGLSDELHQHFTPGRSMEFMDWVADTLGATLAVGLYTYWAWYRKLLEAPLWGRRNSDPADNSAQCP